MSCKKLQKQCKMEGVHDFFARSVMGSGEAIIYCNKMPLNGTELLRSLMSWDEGNTHTPQRNASSKTPRKPALGKAPGRWWVPPKLAAPIIGGPCSLISE